MSTIPQKHFRLSNGKRITIRSPNLTDSGQIIDLTNRVLSETNYLVTQSDEFRVTLEDEQDWIMGFIDETDKLLVVAVYVDTVVGIVNVQAERKRRIRHRADLGIIIDPEFRGQGVGKILMNAVIDWARKHPTIEKVSLSVFEANIVARKLYEGLGFKVQGVRYREYKIAENEYIDDIMMYLWVK